MSEAMCCPLSSDGHSQATVYHQTMRKAAKEHHCYECGETIPRGARYEEVTGIWDGRPERYRTCASCVEIRNHFACGNGWLFGQLWKDLAENFFPDMRAGGPCMEGLSPEAKGRLFELRLRWLEDSGAEIDGAPPPKATP